MIREQVIRLVSVVATALPAAAVAQPSWMPSADAPTSAVLVGHAALADAIALDDGFVSLGTDGLVVRWDVDARVLAWNEVPGARSLVATTDSVVAVGPEVIADLDRHTLVERSRRELIGWVDCADGSLFAWTDNQALFIDGSGITEAAAGSVPFDTAECVVIGTSAWLGWFDGASVHVLGEDLVTADETAWDLESDPRLGAYGPAPAAVAPIVGSAPVVRALTGAITLDDVVGTWSECGLFDTRGVVLPCVEQTPFDARWLVAIPPRPIAASLIAGTLVLAEPFGYVVVTLDAGVPVARAVQSPGARIVALVESSDEVHLVTCEDSAAGASLVALAPVGGGIAAEAVVPGLCPVDAFSRDTSVSLAVGGARVDYSVATGFLADTPDRVNASTPPTGRSRLAFALVGDFMASCQEEAVTLVRTRDGGAAEPVFGPICARDARLVPVDSEDGGFAVGLLTHTRGRWASIVLAPDGSEVWRGTLGAGGQSATRLYSDGEDVWVVDPEANATSDASGEQSFDILPANDGGTARVWSDPRRIWVRANETTVAIRIDRGALLVESADGVWADDALLGRVVVRSSDGIVHLLAGEERTPQPLADLFAAVPEPVEVDVEATGRIRPLMRLADPNRRLMLDGASPGELPEGSGSQ